MQFEFATANRIIFGIDTILEYGNTISEFGKRALIVTGKSQERCKPLIEILDEFGVDQRLFSVDGEPTISNIEKGKRVAYQESCNFVIGFGGGSAIDAGKAIAILTANPGEVLDYLEVIGRSQPFRKPSLPFIAIPTTAGTGTEVTRNAVLESKEHRVKVSMRSYSMLPSLAIVDPALTYNLPAPITAFSGMDALTQLIEPFVSNKANPLTDGYCREGIRRVAQSLERAYMDGTEISAREDMSLASLLGGLALANSKLGAVHGFAGPLGGMYDAPHGAICACLLGPVISVNIKALRQRQPNCQTLGRYGEIARLLTGDERADPEDSVTWIEALAKNLDIPSLRDLGILEQEFNVIIKKAASASSMGGNPIQLTGDEMRKILSRAM